jgi:non-specific serine/threonine protein kinase/serine/threonine-protein kinase
MSSEVFRRAREIFVAAAALPEKERQNYLKEACGTEIELRAEVEELLHFHDAATGDRSQVPTPLQNVASPLEVLQSIGPYRILQKIGAGGMGEVYEAEQEKPLRRRVALKVIKWGMDTKQVVARFESERQALALMDHPNVARVFDAGATGQGRPFFVMEFVKGVPITEYCDARQLKPSERIELFIQVCRGVQHAHQRGIIHRDLKPSNILVTDQDGMATPKIIDFGVAKATSQRLTEQTVFTELGQWIGTPEYMSPEQAGMIGFDIDTRTDVYSLGVVLYELLVGVQPFAADELRSSGFDEMRRKIREEDPPRPSTRVSTVGKSSPEAAERLQTDPSTLARMLRGDLDCIVMMALEKDRNRRYGSPSEFAADLERHLTDQPVLASPPSTRYRVQKFIRRNRLAVIAGGLIALAVSAGVLGTAVGLVRARRQAESARRATDVMVSMYRDLNPRLIQGGVSNPVTMLERAEERIETELADEPLVQARLLTTVGDVYKEMGLLPRARPLFERSAEIRRIHLGEDHLDYAMSISFLGDLLSQIGEFASARRLHEQALEVRRKALGPDHQTVGWSLRSLGHIQRSMGNYDAARSCFQQSVEVLERSVGKDDYDVSITLHSQGLLAMDEGDLEAARPIFERCLAIRERRLPPDHPEIADCLIDYARLLHRLGETERPSMLTSRALAVSRSSFGTDHTQTLGAMAQLAVIKFLAGNIVEAETLYFQIRDIDHRTGRSVLEEFRRHPEFVTMENSIVPSADGS